MNITSSSTVSATEGPPYGPIDSRGDRYRPASLRPLLRRCEHAVQASRVVESRCRRSRSLFDHEARIGGNMAASTMGEFVLAP